jgi:hypothetical protein
MRACSGATPAASSWVLLPLADTLHGHRDTGRIYNTIRPLLLVSTTTTPDIRHIELWLIIYIATTDFVPTKEGMLHKLTCHKDRCLHVKGCEGMTEWADVIVLGEVTYQLLHHDHPAQRSGHHSVSHPRSHSQATRQAVMSYRKTLVLR